MAKTNGPKTRLARCASCRNKTYHLADVGCLNCLARRHFREHGRREWTTEEQDFIEQAYGPRGVASVQWTLYTSFGSLRTHTAIIQQANIRQGINGRAHGDGVLVKKLADELGIHPNNIFRLAKEGAIRLTGTGKYRFVHWDDVDTVRARYAQPPEPVVTMDEFMRRLGYESRFQPRKLLAAGVLRGYKVRGNWYISAAQTDELEAKLREAGATRFSWTEYKRRAG